MKLALNMILKNEERSIIRCLESVKSLVNEMVLVDTGSTDDTLNLLNQFRESNSNIDIKILHFDWVDDFSKARNFAIEQTAAGIILMLDADEFFDSADILKVTAAIKKGIKLKRKFLVEFPFINLVGEQQFKNDLASMKIVKVFPNSPAVRFTRHVHESLQNIQSLSIIKAAAPIYHDGYDPQLVDQLAKKKMYLQLLNQAIQDNPEDDVSMFYFARTIGSFDKDKAKNLMLRLLGMTKSNSVKAACNEYLSRF